MIKLFICIGLTFASCHPINTVLSFRTKSDCERFVQSLGNRMPKFYYVCAVKGTET